MSPHQRRMSRVQCAWQGDGRHHIRKISIYFFTCLLFKKKRGVFCASLLLKMNLGINCFWILGSSSTFRLFHAYESKKSENAGRADRKWHPLLRLVLGRGTLQREEGRKRTRRFRERGTAILKGPEPRARYWRTASGGCAGSLWLDGIMSRVIPVSAP